MITQRRKDAKNTKGLFYPYFYLLEGVSTCCGAGDINHPLRLGVFARSFFLTFLFCGAISHSNAESSNRVGKIFKGTADSPYELTWKKDLVLTGSIISLRYLTLQMPSNIKNYTDEEIQTQFSRNDVNPFDRMFIAPYNDFFKQASGLTNGILWTLPFGFLGLRETRNDFFKIVVMFTQIQLMYPIVTQSINPWAARKRPYFYEKKESMDRRKSGWAQISFLSGHTNFGFAFGTFTAITFSDYYPNSKWKPAVWALAMGTSTATGVFRVLAHEHFPTDVIPGALTGILIGWFVPWIHKKRDSNLSLEPLFTPVGQTGIRLIAKY